MNEKCVNRYKICRKFACLTQEQAAEKLFIDVRTLSDYENGHSKVPDETVDLMAQVYNTPLLGWWHVKIYSVLGKYLPEVPEPKSNGDFAFMAVITGDKYDKAVQIIKKVMAEGEVKRSSEPEFRESLKYIKEVGASCIVMTLYGEGVKIAED